MPAVTSPMPAVTSRQPSSGPARREPGSSRPVRHSTSYRSSRPASVRRAQLTAEALHVGERPEVEQLLWVDDRADGLHLPVGDVEHEDVDQAAVRVEEHGPGLPVEFGLADGDPELADLAAQAEHQAADAVAAGDRARPRWAHAAAVTADNDVRGEHRDQPVHVPVADGAEEPAGQFLTLAAGGLETRPALADVAARTEGQLAAVAGVLGDDAGDLVVVVAEDVVKKEDGE